MFIYEIKGVKPNERDELEELIVSTDKREMYKGNKFKFKSGRVVVKYIKECLEGYLVGLQVEY